MEEEQFRASIQELFQSIRFVLSLDSRSSENLVFTQVRFAACCYDVQHSASCGNVLHVNVFFLFISFQFIIFKFTSIINLFCFLLNLPSCISLPTTTTATLSSCCDVS